MAFCTFWITSVLLKALVPAIDKAAWWNCDFTDSTLLSTSLNIYREFLRACKESRSSL